MSFPTDVNEFMNDPRISFSKLDNKWLLETDGREFNWEERIGHWVESVRDKPHLLALRHGRSLMHHPLGLTRD